MLFYIIIILILLIYFNRNYNVDNNKSDAKKAYKILLKIRENYKKLIKYCNKKANTLEELKYKNYIDIIEHKIDNVEIQENTNIKNGTSFSINKGEIIYICLRNKNGNLHDMNKIMYVAIHELSHIGCPEKNHTQLFYKINKYLLKKSIECGIYNYEDYRNDEYCGIQLNENILN